MFLSSCSCSYVAARFGDRKEPGRGPSCCDASARPCHFTSRDKLVMRIDFAIGSHSMWRVKIIVPVTTTEHTAIKKLAEAVEVAIAKRTLGVYVGLLPRKRIGIILRRP